MEFSDLSGWYKARSGQIYGVSDAPGGGASTLRGNKHMAATDCSQLLPWLGLLILLNAVEIMLLIAMTVRFHTNRETVMDAVEARLMEIDKSAF
jgi:hypothetical protein